MLDAAERAGVRHAVGLQGQMSPAINYVKGLVVEGYVGRVLSATLIGCAPNWGASIDRAYQADRANGANLMTITGGHQIEDWAFGVTRADRSPKAAFHAVRETFEQSTAELLRGEIGSPPRVTAIPPTRRCARRMSAPAGRPRG